MQFEDLRVKEVRNVLRYSTNMRKWQARNRRDHFVGIKLCGSALHTFADKSFVLYGNCIYFFNQRDDYDVEVYESGTAYSVHFTTYEEIDTPSFCIPIEQPDEFLSLLQKAEQLHKSGEGGELLLLSTVYKLLATVSAIRQKKYAPSDARMHAAREYIDLHFQERDCMSRAVEQSKLSLRRFCDLFKQSFDVTPNRYLTLRKIQHAKSLLEMQSLTVTEIAELCGFSDVYYFSKT